MNIRKSDVVKFLTIIGILLICIAIGMDQETFLAPKGENYDNIGLNISELSELHNLLGFIGWVSVIIAIYLYCKSPKKIVSSES